MKDGRQGIGPDLRDWGEYVNLVSWTQLMWSNASTMMQEMALAGIKWPQLSGRDLEDIVAYIRSISDVKSKQYLFPGAPANGKTLFDSKNCSKCHSVGKTSTGNCKWSNCQHSEANTF